MLFPRSREVPTVLMTVLMTVLLTLAVGRFAQNTHLITYLDSTFALRIGSDSHSPDVHSQLSDRTSDRFRGVNLDCWEIWNPDHKKMSFTSTLTTNTSPVSMCHAKSRRIS